MVRCTLHFKHLLIIFRSFSNLSFFLNRENAAPEVEKEVKDAEPSADEEETEKSTNGDAAENGDTNEAEDKKEDEEDKKEEKDSTGT